MDEVAAQYEHYPYPERDPADEARRLITGSPSDLAEIDHFLFGGKRDWRQPFRALVAGGGTGDGLIQLAQQLDDTGCPAEITYLDLSHAARGVAEARAKARGLSGIRFLTGDILQAPELGRFDYVDCCGVLHHLEDPQAGFDALAKALAPGGGIGLMVYAPYGRTGVYPLQAAFAALFAGDAPAEKVALARAALAALPESNWFLKNTGLSDHRASDAGLYDLLLHARDVPFDVEALLAALQAAGLELVSFTEPARYDPARYLPNTDEFRERIARLDLASRMALAERLAGDLRSHVCYAVPAGRAGAAMAKPTPEAVPRLAGIPAAALAGTVSKRGRITIDYDGVKHRIDLPRDSARLIALIDGRPLGRIAAAVGLDWIGFMQAWGPVHRGLTGFNRLRYSRFACA
ncbi:MAG: class I SAM-dependent methyltransferase [Alphaproteobacteria bacterium]|nr:MAG: class I SAM-dependent methyltransferase [Alphaproteobacteria bacterium]